MLPGPLTLAWAFDPWTYALVAIVALLLFGKRLPDVGRSLGRGIAEFKKGLRDVQDELNQTGEPPPTPRNKLQPPGGTTAAAPQLPPNEPQVGATPTPRDDPEPPRESNPPSP